MLSNAVATAGGRPYLFDQGPLSELLTEMLPCPTFEQLAVPLTAMAVDLDTGELVSLEAGELHSALLASAAIPGVYPWVERDGRRLVDGGLLANVPLRQAVDRGAASVVVLECGQYRPESRRGEGLLEVVVQALAIATRQQVQIDLAVAADVPVVYLPAPEAIRSTLFDFAHTEPLSEQAFVDTVAMLARLADRDEPLGPGLYGAPPVLAANPAVAGLRRH
jgi:NTE family protein